LPSTVVSVETAKNADSDLKDAAMSGGLVFLFFVTLILTIVLPVAVYPEWIHFTYTAGTALLTPFVPFSD
jgi:hypothetical protein